MVCNDISLDLFVYSFRYTYSLGRKMFGDHEWIDAIEVAVRCGDAMHKHVWSDSEPWWILMISEAFESGRVFAGRPAGRYSDRATIRYDDRLNPFCALTWLT